VDVDVIATWSTR